ncbi:uncharacterized protein P884DRAFT_263382 [Thermothelomyces heterothallicus CBS 202.75]|uniref:uncharacterized protein n=1 Tax=Thermothelomyces heterothallicus CBS 202.75 TaxID=1149848 RepID=UPI00374281AE
MYLRVMSLFVCLQTTSPKQTIVSHLLISYNKTHISLLTCPATYQPQPPSPWLSSIRERPELTNLLQALPDARIRTLMSGPSRSCAPRSQRA